MNENGGRSTNILLTVIGIATLLVVVTGATFAYFAAVVNGDDGATSVYIQAAKDGLTVTQVGGQSISLKGIYPRAESWAHQTFGLLVDADESTAIQDVTFKMNVTTNDINVGLNANDLKYTFIRRTTGTSKEDIATDLGDKDFIVTATEGNNTTGYVELTNMGKTKAVVPATGTETTIVTATRPHNIGGAIVYDLNIYYDERDANQNTGTERNVELKITGQLDN